MDGPDLVPYLHVIRGCSKFVDSLASKSCGVMLGPHIVNFQDGLIGSWLILGSINSFRFINWFTSISMFQPNFKGQLISKDIFDCVNYSKSVRKNLPCPTVCAKPITIICPVTLTVRDPHYRNGGSTYRGVLKYSKVNFWQFFEFIFGRTDIAQCYCTRLKPKRKSPF